VLCVKNGGKSFAWVERVARHHRKIINTHLVIKANHFVYIGKYSKCEGGTSVECGSGIDDTVAFVPNLFELADRTFCCVTVMSY
jgi:hypothetical protein